MRIVLALLIGLLPLIAAALLWRRSRATRDIPTLRAVAVAAGAFVLSWGCQLAERALWEWTGLTLSAEAGKEVEALLAMLLFAAPLEEGAKVLSIWPLYSARRLLRTRHAIVLSALAGLGFAAGEASSSVLFGHGVGLLLVRSSIAIPAHVVCAVIWGSTLGAGAKTSWFALAWGAATLLHGLFDHIVFGRGPGVMVLALPLLMTSCALAYVIARKAVSREALLAPAPYTGQERSRSIAAGWSEPPSIRQVWQALQPKQEPLMLHWIVLGTLVTAGLGLVALGVALYAGHALGLDFAAANEADVRSNGPLVFLASAVGLAFPIAGYLVARASGTRSVLEPALGASLAVLGGVLFLSVTTPIAAVVALALAPVAFVLASGGAWFGMGH
jgi:RsiW-degrading membrane proteinase PrsW (M82 family)